MGLSAKALLNWMKIFLTDTVIFQDFLVVRKGTRGFYEIGVIEEEQNKCLPRQSLPTSIRPCSV